MNTPPKPKPLSRFNTEGYVARLPKGVIYGGIKNDALALRVGRIAGQWPHVEEAMVRLLAVILDTDELAARQIFRSIINQHARITMMRNLLENILQAVDLDEDVDRAISEFETLNAARNAYLHGIWMTDVETGKVYLAEADTIHFVYLPSRRVTEKELDRIYSRMEDLQLNTHKEVNDHRTRKAYAQQRKIEEQRQAWLETQSPRDARTSRRRR